MNHQLPEGYVVVVKDLEDNPRYKGLDRTPPFDMDAFGEGFDDPWLSGEYPDDSGLLPSLDFGERIRQRYAQAYGEDKLELVYGRIWKVDQPGLSSLGLRFIGFDVAGEDLHFCSAIREYRLWLGL